MPPTPTRVVLLLLALIAPRPLFAAPPTPPADAKAAPALPKTDVYDAGADGYHTYRIPAVVLTPKNVLLAFGEGRKNSRADNGDIDLVLRRSPDGGRTWLPMQLVYEEGGTANVTIGNPCPVVDHSTGIVWLAFCRDNKRVLVTNSADDGVTWAKPTEITEAVSKPDWSWFATGPGHAIQLRSGRLVFPCDCMEAAPAKVKRSFVFYSDDHGRTWTAGSLSGEGMNECQVAELADGALLLSMRNYLGKNRRAFSVSRDGGATWTEPQLNDQVFCPTCQASLLRAPGEEKERVIYAGPAGPRRSHLTLRMSEDGGKTWPISRELYAGDAAYSDLVALPDGSIGCLYERDGYRHLSFARFTVEWLTAGNQP